MGSSADTVGWVKGAPFSPEISKIVDTYFYIETESTEAKFETEAVIPFPRITLGYFFDQPYLAKNLKTGENKTLNLAIAKIQDSVIEVSPSGKITKILGAHLKPYALALLCDLDLKSIPWVCDPQKVFKTGLDEFRHKADANNCHSELFLDEKNLCKNEFFLRQGESSSQAQLRSLLTQNFRILCFTTQDTIEVRFRSFSYR